MQGIVNRGIVSCGKIIKLVRSNRTVPKLEIKGPVWVQGPALPLTSLYLNKMTYKIRAR